MTNGLRHADTVVIGAGIVGTAIALALARTGRRILLIDRDAPGHACSRGNAGIIATSEIEPLVSFRTISRLPSLMFDPLGPLRISPRAFLRLLPWFYRAGLSARRAKREAATEALAALSEHALGAHLRLLPEAERRGLIRCSGMIDVMKNPKALPLLQARKALCDQYGIAVETLTSEELRELEPGLARGLAGGLFHRKVAHVSDPMNMIAAYVEAFKAYGGVLHRAQVGDIHPVEDGVELTLGDARLRAGNVVVAAGLGSTSLLARFAKAIPLASERGYHIQFAGHGDILQRPVMFMSDSFVATPLMSGLRLAGTAEFATETEEPDWRRADVLLQASRAYLGRLDPAGSTRWMGSRPTFPDSLPAIGRIEGAQIHYAFGHQHLGLTLAAITAEIVADMVVGRPAPTFLSPLSLERFA